MLWNMYKALRKIDDLVSEETWVAAMKDSIEDP